MKSEKLLEMEEYIRFRQTISLKELQEHFNISINTVRRYIAVLLEQNSDFQKVYGGITVKNPQRSSLSPYPNYGEIPQMSEKHRLCKYAASQIQAYDIVYIDNGTSVSFIPYLNFPHQHGVLNLENSIFQPLKKA